jgi:hypothetical protein
MTEQRAKDIGEARKRHVELRFYAGRVHNARRAGTLTRVFEQRCLPDPGFAAKGQSAAATCQRLIEKQVDACSLFAPPYEHARTVR